VNRTYVVNGEHVLAAPVPVAATQHVPAGGDLGSGSQHARVVVVLLVLAFVAVVRGVVAVVGVPLKRRQVVVQALLAHDLSHGRSRTHGGQDRVAIVATFFVVIVVEIKVQIVQMSQIKQHFG
jgi:hypothetical protein